MQSYKQLRVWQRAHALTLTVYRLAANLPADERFGLCSQLQRAAVSVPSNIVEGSYARATPNTPASSTSPRLLWLKPSTSCCWLWTSAT